MTSAITKAEPTLLDTLATAEWPKPVIDILRRQIYPKGIPEDDFYVFVRKCVQTGLNPLVGEAYCIPRNNKGPDGKPVTVYTFQPSAEGMRARAGRFPDFVKVDGAAVHELDAVAMVDEGKGEVEHKFNAAKARGRLMGAWGRVVKKGTTPVVVWLPAGSRSGNTPFWNADPGGMTAKCAMVAALRQAYPVAFAGVYAAEEMQNEAPTSSVVETVLARASGEAPPSAETTSPALPVGALVEYGDWKGRPIAGLSVDEANAAEAFAKAKMTEQPKAKWVEKMRANMEAIQAHRDSLLSPDPAKPVTVEAELVTPVNLDSLFEPGSEG